MSIDKCPYCYQRLGTWLHDPILKPQGAEYDWISDTELVFEPDEDNRWYKGTQQLREDEIIELQTALKDLEESYLTSNLTDFSPVNVSGKFQCTGKHIKEMRDSVEKLLTEFGRTKTEYFNYDNEYNHIIHPNGDKLEWSDPITVDTDLSKFQIKYIHIEDLRHYLLIMWEDFTPTGSDSASAVAASSADIHTFNLQKRQLWSGTAYAGHEFYDHYQSNGSSNISIGSVATGNAVAAAVQNPNHVGVSVYSSACAASGGASAQIPQIIIGGIGTLDTKYPLTKQIYNPITGQLDTYHLFVKADCSVSMSASGGYSKGTAGDVFLAYGSKSNPPIEVTQWNAAPKNEPNTSAVSQAYVLLNIPVRFSSGGGLYISLSQDVYHNCSTPAGYPTLLNNFDIDLAEAMDNIFGIMTGYVSGFGIGANAGGSANNFDQKAADAYWVDDPLIPGEDSVIWFGPFNPTGGFTSASASFTIDNINFYYKKVVTP
jgi:hypothetical protein